jgi:peptidoglycan hydrolase-like protein with peptidoglycan-binding domain
MNPRLFALAAALLGPLTAGAAGGAFTALHPEAAIPDPDSRVQSGPYSDLISRVQERLRALGFDAGPVNGDFGTKTQAALAQFQLSVPVPASGQLDDPTLAALGIKRDAQEAGSAPSESAAAGAGARP